MDLSKRNRTKEPTKDRLDIAQGVGQQLTALRSNGAAGGQISHWGYEPQIGHADNGPHSGRNTVLLNSASLDTSQSLFGSAEDKQEH
jgi:hypothetical protein